MRNWKMALYWILGALPLLMVLIFLPGIPDQIPMQYDFSGAVSRMGHKYELLLVPVITLFIVSIFHFIGRHGAKKSAKGAQNQRVLYACGNSISICFCVLTLTMVYYTGSGTKDILQTHAYQIISFIMSVLLLLLGNLMPKCKRSDRMWLAVGVRTPWTLKDDAVWNKTNRIGGYWMAGIGAFGIVVSLIAPDMWGFIAVTGLLAIAAICLIVYSWILYRRLHQALEND